MIAGFAKLEITPIGDCSLLGYAEREAGNAGVHDPLFARAVVFGDAALVSLDLCILLPEFAGELRGVIAEELGIPATRVLLSCTHTHSGPYPFVGPSAAGLFQAAPMRESNVAFVDSLPGKLRAVVRRAAGNRQPVECLAVAETPLPIAYNRRVPMSSGIRHCWNPAESPELQPLPAVDQTCAVLTIGGIKVWSFGAHPVVLGKRSRVISADWPGAACAAIGGDNLFVLGACGETHPWLATQDDPGAVKTVGERVAECVRSLTGTRGESGLEIAARDDVAVWRIGPAWLVAAPVELFGELAVDLRRQLRAPVILATNTNGWTGYWPTRAAFAEGGYEVDGAVAMGRRPGDGERLVAELVALAQTLEPRRERR
jgi:hypothetical protein